MTQLPVVNIKNSKWFLEFWKFSFPTLPVVEVKLFDVNELLKDVKEKDKNNVLTLVNILLKEKEQDDTINKFEGWSNHFLSQLVHFVTGELLDKTYELKLKCVEDKRHHSNLNNIYTVERNIENIYINKTRLLSKEEEYRRNYVISSSGLSLIKETIDEINKLDKIEKKITLFSKKKVK